MLEKILDFFTTLKFDGSWAQIPGAVFLFLTLTFALWQVARVLNAEKERSDARDRMESAREERDLERDKRQAAALDRTTDALVEVAAMHAETGAKLEAHIHQDDERFQRIGGQLDRMENRIDDLHDHLNRNSAQ